jgi:tight junction protein 1
VFSRDLRGGGEVGEGGDGEEVLATARGVFTHEGGTLSSPDTGVAIIIPPGALPVGSQQEVYFKVCRDTSVLPPLDQEKGKLPPACILVWKCAVSQLL